MLQPILLDGILMMKYILEINDCPTVRCIPWLQYILPSLTRCCTNSESLYTIPLVKSVDVRIIPSVNSLYIIPLVKSVYIIPV